MHRLFLGLIAALAWPSLAAAAPDCSRKDAEIPARTAAFRDCVFGTAEPLGFNGEGPAQAVADASVAACKTQHDAAISYMTACDPDAAATLEPDLRAAVVEFVSHARLPRADRLWLHGDWHKGACALDDAQFKKTVYAHLDCIRGFVVGRIKADKEIPDFAALVDAGVAACSAKAAPVRAVFAKCVADPDALFTSYRAGAMESVLADMVAWHVRDKVLTQEQQKDEKLAGLINDYGACVALEAHLRKGEGDVAAARREAIRVCGLDRLVLRDVLPIALPEDQQPQVARNIDILAKVEATVELPDAPGGH